MHISAMVTIQVSAPEKRHIKDAYRFTGFTPLARLERLPNNTSHSESWAVTLRRRGNNIIKEFVNNCAGKLEIYFLPGYAPELNPDEFVWHEIKQNGTSKRPLNKNESLKERVESDLAELKGDRVKLRNFFASKHVDYIMN